MKRIISIVLVVIMLSATGCSTSNISGSYDSATSDSEKSKMSYKQIDQETAKEMMSRDDGHVIVDVRTQDEYDTGHIPGAILIPNESIGNVQPEELPDLNQVILIYCRSGNRSKQAAQKFADIGYTEIYEFGGIIDWDGEIITGDEKN